MNARRLIVAAVVSLCSLASLGASLSTLVAAASAEESCPNAASRQGPSVALPDCRAYEQLTPVSKADSTDIFASGLYSEEAGTLNEGGYAAEDGNRFLFKTEGSFAGGDATLSGYVFSRGTTGWTTTSLSPGAGVHAVEPRVFDPSDLSTVGFEDLDLTYPPGQPAKAVTNTLLGAPGGPYTTAVAALEGGGGELKGASADLSHIVLESTDHELVPAPPGTNEGAPALDEWAGGQVRPIDIATDGSPISPCGATFGGGETGEGSAMNPNAISSDGSKILFTAPSPYVGCWNQAAEEDPPQLYMRIDGTSTVEISAPNSGVNGPAGPRAAYYVGASADDTKVFFITRAQLTADDPGHATELYEYDLRAPEGERLTRISGGETGTAEGAVQYVPIVSNDGSTVYFTAYGKLAAGATAGSLSLYYYDTVSHQTRYITEDSDFYPMEINNPFLQSEGAGWAAAVFGRGSPEIAVGNDTHANWTATANGQYLLFTSTQPLTGYDNVGVDETTFGTNRSFAFEELFRYSVAQNTLVCVSCAVGSPPPIDNATFNRGVRGVDFPDAGPPHAISEDGSYAFFETMSALVPQAIPGRLHVYEWHSGRISLISSADDPGGAFFLGASADGSNVFIGTHAQLVPGDTDVGGDIYDARIDGGFVGDTPSQCTGTGCQGIPSAPPIFATPASVTFGGVGNFPAAQPPVKPRSKPAKCKRGFAKKHGRCVRKKAKKPAKGRK
jgi:hypothetical protein